MLAWLSGLRGAEAGADAAATTLLNLSTSPAVSRVISALRTKIVSRVHDVNGTTEQEVTDAARHVSLVVDRARQYVVDSQQVLGSLDGGSSEGLGGLLGSIATLVRGHVKDMTSRAAVQDERARRAATLAKNILDLAAAIDRLAGEARLLAVNARIESSRLGAQSAGFEVLATEMQRLSDEVASTNEQVEDLASRLGHDLPAMAAHSQALRMAMEQFASDASHQIAETEQGVARLLSKIGSVSRQGAEVMEAILAASHAALSHLQFQDVVAQQLRQIDSWVRDCQLAVIETIDSNPAAIAAVPPPEYTTQGEHESGPQIADSGEVTLF